MNGNSLIEFEEQNYDWLVEKLIKKCQEEWMEIIENEYNKAQREPDDVEDR